MALTKKQLDFCEYYLELGNGAEAARKAGYSARTAYSAAFELLKKPEISKYINERLEEMQSKRVASADEIMQFYTSVMRGEVKDAFDLEPSLDTRISAADKLMKRYNAVHDKNRTSVEKLDALLEEFKNAVKSETT